MCTAFQSSKWLLSLSGHCILKFPGDLLPIYNPEECGYHFNSNKGYFDGFVILANSMYGKIGKSAEEKIHYVKEVIIHPEYVCIL